MPPFDTIRKRYMKHPKSSNPDERSPDRGHTNEKPSESNLRTRTQIITFHDIIYHAVCLMAVKGFNLSLTAAVLGCDTETVKKAHHELYPDPMEPHLYGEDLRRYTILKRWKFQNGGDICAESTLDRLFRYALPEKNKNGG